MQSKPIGVFDSGLGGLTVVKELIKDLPNEDILFLGDTARVPYGTRSKEVVQKFSLEDANFLLSKNVKCIVIACNTSSALAGGLLKSKMEIPVFDVIAPATREAKRVSKTGNIGVIGTRGTIDSGAYKVLYSKNCPLFVPFIEEGEINSPALKILVKSYLSTLKGKIDTLIMGCTHYPIIENLIRNEVTKDVILVNPGKCVSKDVKNYLIKNNMLNGQNKNGDIKYFVTDLTERFVKVAEIFLEEKIKGKIYMVSINS
jgi:glutamate racemase